MAPPSLPQIKKTLLDHVEEFFNSQNDLSAEECDIHLGLYYRDKPVSPHARTEQLGLSTPFFYRYDTTPVTMSALTDYPNVVNRPPDLFNGANFTPPFVTFLIDRRADLVWDDETELLASGFPFTDVVTNLSYQTRAKVYDNPLAAVRKPESGDGGGRLKNFFPTAAQEATYDHTDQYRNYYAKWRAPKPTTAEQRLFDLDHLSDQYLRLNFTPMELQKDRVYLLVEVAGGIRVLFFLFLDTTGRRRRPRLDRTQWYVQGIYDNDGNALRPLGQLLQRDTNLRPRLLFLYALDGSLGLPSWRFPATSSAGKLRFPDEEVIDPRLHVRRLWNLPHDAPDPKPADKWTYRNWVEELIRLKFSEQWVWLRDNPYGGRLTPRPKREDLFLNKLREAAAESKGETRKRLLDFIREAEQDKNLYMIRRGTENGRYLTVIGSDNHYVYLHHKYLGLVVRINHEVYFEDYFALGIFLKDIYRSTAWIIPFAQIICWGGVAVMGIGIFGTAALAAGIRSYLTERLTSTALKPALQKALRKFETELIMMFVNSVLAFFPKTRETALVRGFLTGYTTDTFEALFSKWYSLASLEPTSFKVLKYTYKIQAALGRLDDRMSQLKSMVDDQAARALQDRFVHFLVSMWKATIMLSSNLQYLDYDQVKPLLDIVAKLGQKAPTTRQEWDRFRQDHLLKSLTEFDKKVRESLADVTDLYADAQTAVQLGRQAFWVANVAFAANKATGGMLTDPIVLGPLFGLGVGAAALTNPQATYKAASTGVRLFIDELVQLGNYGPKEMEQFGRLLGRFAAALSLNKKLFGPGMKLGERWKLGNLGRRVKEQTIRDELGLGWFFPLIKLAGFHYVIMLDSVIDATKQVKKRWDDLQDDIETILLGDPANWDLFPPDEQDVDLEKIARIIVKLDDLLTEWLKELGKIPDLRQKIELLTATLKKARDQQTTPKIPTLEDIIDGKVGPEWPRDALTFVLLWSLHAAVNELADALRYFTETVNPKGLLALSIAGLFELLDFRLNSTEVATILDSNLDDLLASQATP
jgi:hypothetical protein